MKALGTIRPEQLARMSVQARRDFALRAIPIEQRLDAIESAILALSRKDPLPESFVSLSESITKIKSKQS